MKMVLSSVCCRIINRFSEVETSRDIGLLLIYRHRGAARWPRSTHVWEFAGRAGRPLRRVRSRRRVASCVMILG